MGVISYIQLLLKYMNCQASTVRMQFRSLTVNEPHLVQGRAGVGDFCQGETKPSMTPPRTRVKYLNCTVLTEIIAEPVSALIIILILIQ